MIYPFFTIGHSARPISEFIKLLEVRDVRLVVDVRAAAPSRTNIQYNAAALSETLQHAGISYEHMAALGGHRGGSRDISPSVNRFWVNQSFHNYADYAMTDPFRVAFARLRELGRERKCAIMCAEAVW